MLRNIRFILFLTPFKHPSVSSIDKPEGGIVCIGWRLLSDENIREGSASMECYADWLCLVLGTRFSTPVNSQPNNKYQSTSKAPKTQTSH